MIFITESLVIWNNKLRQIWIGFSRSDYHPKMECRNHHCSDSRSLRFRSIISPSVFPKYPPIFPSERMTLWQGTSGANGFFLNAWPTACGHRQPMRRASSPYEMVCPAGTFSSSRKTFFWNSVISLQDMTFSRMSVIGWDSEWCPVIEHAKIMIFSELLTGTHLFR